MPHPWSRWPSRCRARPGRRRRGRWGGVKQPLGGGGRRVSGAAARKAGPPAPSAANPSRTPRVRPASANVFLIVRHFGSLAGWLVMSFPSVRQSATINTFPGHAQGIWLRRQECRRPELATTRAWARSVPTPRAARARGVRTAPARPSACRRRTPCRIDDGTRHLGEQANKLHAQRDQQQHARGGRDEPQRRVRPSPGVRNRAPPDRPRRATPRQVNAPPRPSAPPIGIA